jgi:SpoVK/Ycf46/Vps4 family AAA+-type ATPase
MIDTLVMDEQRKKILKAQTVSFLRTNKMGFDIERKAWSADYVEGKGNGLIFLLHGGPGVGKTYTAGWSSLHSILSTNSFVINDLSTDKMLECIAQYLQRPLMIITGSDIGTETERVDKNLTAIFKRAAKWGAVLLFDEADVFLEMRKTRDLKRNSLVASK